MDPVARSEQRSDNPQQPYPQQPEQTEREHQPAPQPPAPVQPRLDPEPRRLPRVVAQLPPPTHEASPQVPTPVPYSVPDRVPPYGPPDPSHFSTSPPLRELKVEDALMYLDLVKQHFGNQPRIYNEFLDVMKNFKAQEIDTPGVIKRVSTLFKGYPRLILGFNTFLPPGFKIKPEDTSPNPKPVSRLAVEDVSLPAAPKPAPTPSPEPRGNENPSFVSGVRTTQPVEFDHAINYVTTIKRRFANQPKIYKSFLEILHTYQKEQRTIKQVLEQVSHLFRDHPDLLREFTYFLPDAVQEQAKERLNRAAEKAVARRAQKEKLSKMRDDKVDRRDKKHGKETDTEKERMRERMRSNKELAKKEREREKQKIRYADKKAKKRPYEEKDRRDRHAYEESTVLSTEWRFFERVKKLLPSRECWREFLKCLDLYSLEIVGREEMIALVGDLFGRHTDVLNEFKKMLSERGARDSQSAVWFSMPLAEIDFSQCRRCTPSYRALPVSYPNPPCSERSELEKSVCNDAWVSVPTGSEDFSFKNMRKNQYEEALFKCEDERFEIDMVIDANASTIRILEPLAMEIEALREGRDVDGPNADLQQWQYRLDKRTLGTVHLNAISRIYGEQGNEVLEMLRKHPAGTIPVMLKRLKQKDEEWRRARQDLNKQWKDVLEKNFHKSLDHCSFYFKQSDKKQISTKGLVSEIKAKYEEDKKIQEAENAERAVKFAEEEGTETPDPNREPWRPHLTFKYSVPSVHKDVYAVLCYAAEHNLSTADKERVACIWKDMITKFFHLPEEWLKSSPKSVTAPDTVEKALTGGTEVSTQYGSGTIVCFDPKSTVYIVDVAFGRAWLQPSLVEVCEDNAFPDCVPVSDDIKHSTPAAVDSPVSRPEEILVGNQNAYVFVRLHYMLYDRLSTARELCDKAQRNRSRMMVNPAAWAFAHSGEKDRKEKAGDYQTFLTTLYALLDNSVDNTRYEDACRNIMGTSSFMLFTLDKLVSHILKQLQTLVTDETCVKLQAEYCAAQEMNQPIVPSEYMNKCRGVFDGDDAYRIQFNPGVLRQTALQPPESPPVSRCPTKIWAPSPRVRSKKPSPWLVEPTMRMEVIESVEENKHTEETPNASPAHSSAEESGDKIDVDSTEKSTPVVSPVDEGPDEDSEVGDEESNKQKKRGADDTTAFPVRAKTRALSRGSEQESDLEAGTSKRKRDEVMEQSAPKKVKTVAVDGCSEAPTETRPLTMSESAEESKQVTRESTDT